MKMKGPSKKRIRGVEEKNILVPVGEAHVIPRKFCLYLSFIVDKGFPKDSKRKTNEEDPKGEHHKRCR